MQKLSIFYGSTTGGCGTIAELIKKEIGNNLVDLYNIVHAKPSDIENHKNSSLAYHRGTQTVSKKTGCCF